MSKQSSLIRFYTNLNDALLQCTNEVLMLIFTIESVLSVRFLKMLRICMGSVLLFVEFPSVPLWGVYLCL